MKILLAPAKKMIVNDDDVTPRGLPVCIRETEELLRRLRGMSQEQLAETWKCSDRLMRENTARLERMELYSRLTPAVYAYVGLAYQHLCAGGMSDEEIGYLQEHLRILSGFYGILRPLDGVTPYRLEMQAVMPGYGDLYAFWGDRLYKELKDDVIVDLASKEYSRSIVPYLKDTDRYIEIVFAEYVKGKPVTKGTMAKMARGEMVSWMAQNAVTDPDQLKRFDRGYAYSEEQSDPSRYVFLRKEGKQKR